jgi:hypothetical protein
MLGGLFVLGQVKKQEGVRMEGKGYMCSHARD